MRYSLSLFIARRHNATDFHQGARQIHTDVRVTLWNFRLCLSATLMFLCAALSSVCDEALLKEL